MDGLAVEGAVALDGLAVVQPDPDPDAAVGVLPPIPLEGLLDGDGAAQAGGWRVEGGQEAVAEEGRLGPAVLADGPPHDRLVLVEDLVGDPVTMPGPELGRPLHVGEQQRDRAAVPLVHGPPRVVLLAWEGSTVSGAVVELVVELDGGVDQ